MAHCRTFFRKFSHALQYPYVECPVRDEDTEEPAFEFAVLVLMLLRFPSALRQFLPLPLSVAFPYQSVVFGLDVGRTDILRAFRVHAEVVEQVYHVSPH